MYAKSLFTRSNLTDYQTKVCIASKFCSSSNLITALYTQFKFIVEEDVALPVDPAFWDYLISTSQRDWSLLVYEQDWLYVQFIRTKALQVCQCYCTDHELVDTMKRFFIAIDTTWPW